VPLALLAQQDTAGGVFDDGGDRGGKRAHGATA
jgi:hypothetical protein